MDAEEREVVGVGPCAQVAEVDVDRVALVVAEDGAAVPREESAATAAPRFAMSVLEAAEVFEGRHGLVYRLPLQNRDAGPIDVDCPCDVRCRRC